MPTVTASPCRLWILVLTTSLTLTACVGANSRINKTYTVGSILVEPFLMRQHDGHMDTDTEYQGFIPDLIKELGNLIGVHFKIILQPDGKFGSQRDDGAWDGLMGSLVRNDIDMAAGPLTITSLRARVIDFSKRFMSTGLVLVISGGTHEGAAPAAMSRVGLIFKPFTPIAWCMLLAAILMIAVVAVGIHRLNHHGEKTDHMAQLTTCSGGGQYSGCVLRTTMLLFVLLTVVLYTAGVVDIHPARTDDAQSNHEQANIHDIVKSGKYKIAAVRGGATDYFFRISTVPLYERINQELTYVHNVSAGFDLVHKDPGYAFITDRDLVEYYTSRKPYCGMYIVGESLNTNGYGLGLPLGSPLREPTNLAILQMQESGILQMLFNKWWRDRRQCGKKASVPAKKRSAPASPGIDSAIFGGVLIILAIGLLLAVGAAVVERFLHHKSSQGDGKAQTPSDPATP